MHKDTRSQKLELKKQSRLCLNTHICAWNFAHNLWKDLRTHFHFCLLSFLVAPFVHRAVCASWPRGLGISRTRLDTSNSLSKGQHSLSARSLSSTGTTLIPARTSSYIGVLRQHIRHIVAAWDLPQCDLAIFHQSLEPQISDLQMTHTSQPSGRCERFGRRRIC